MANEEIEISELEYREELSGDDLIPVETSTNTFATTLTALKNWLKSFFVGKTGDETIEGNKTFSGKTSLGADTIFRRQDAQNEGGQLFLQKAANGTLPEDVYLDVYENNFRVVGENSKNIKTIPFQADLENNYCNINFPPTTNGQTTATGKIVQVGSRGFYKSNAVKCWAVLVKKSEGYSSLLLIGETEESVMGYDDYDTTPRNNGTFTYRGKDYYFMISGNMMPTTESVSRNEDVLTYPVMYTTPSSVMDWLSRQANYSSIPMKTYQIGSSWYRIWADGWIEQGGWANNGTTVTFPKAFKNTDYFVVAIPNVNTASNDTQYASSAANGRTTTGFTLACGRNYRNNWYACGY